MHSIIFGFSSCGFGIVGYTPNSASNSPTNSLNLSSEQEYVDVTKFKISSGVLNVFAFTTCFTLPFSVVLYDEAKSISKSTPSRLWANAVLYASASRFIVNVVPRV